jgi:hypothetical protein
LLLFSEKEIGRKFIKGLYRHDVILGDKKDMCKILEIGLPDTPLLNLFSMVGIFAIARYPYIHITAYLKAGSQVSVYRYFLILYNYRMLKYRLFIRQRSQYLGYRLFRKRSNNF